MAERVLEGRLRRFDLQSNRSPKAEPLAKVGGKVVDKLSELSGGDIVFTISAEEDVEQVYFGKDGVLSTNKTPPVFVTLDHRGRGIRVEIRKRLRSAAPTSSARR